MTVQFLMLENSVTSKFSGLTIIFTSNQKVLMVKVKGTLEALFHINFAEQLPNTLISTSKLAGLTINQSINRSDAKAFKFDIPFGNFSLPPPVIKQRKIFLAFELLG